MEYLVSVKIGRTKCKRNITNNLSCPFQSKKKLQKVCAAASAKGLHSRGK